MTASGSQKSSLSARVMSFSLGFALVALAVTTGLQKIRSFDYWWHLKAGQLISATGVVPKTDPFSFSAEGSRWIDIHWLFQIGLHKLYVWGGHEAVVWGKVALVLLLVAILGGFAARRGRPAVTGAALALMLILASDRFMARPELLSFACLATLLVLFHRFERSRDWLIFAVVPIQLFWANVHGLSAVGVVVCGIYLFSEIVDSRLLGKRPVDRLRVLRLACVTGLAALVSVANPNGLEAALYPLQQLTMIGTADLRAASPQTLELMSIGGYWVGMNSLAKSLLVFATLFSLSSMVANRKRLRTSDALLWLAFAILALAARRNLALFAVVMAPIAIRNWNEFLDARPLRPRLQQLATVAVILAITATAVDISRNRFFGRLGWLRESGSGLMEIMQPTAATQWIADNQPTGPIFHSMIDGGFLIWHLYPDYQVLGDGRLEVYGIERRKELGVRLPKGFRLLDEKYHFNTALLNFGRIDYGRLLAYLYQSPEWRLVFVDDIAAVFTRADRSNIGSEIDVTDPLLLSPKEHEHGVSDAYRRKARQRFFQALGQGVRAKEIRVRMIRDYPEYRR